MDKEIRKQKGIVNHLCKGLKRQVFNLYSEKNNAHHWSGKLPESCVPSGMYKGYSSSDTVVIKSLQMQELCAQRIDQDIDILQEQLLFAIEEIAELKEELESFGNMYSTDPTYRQE